MPIILTPDPTIGQPITQTGLLYFANVTTYPGIAAISTTGIADLTLIEVIIANNLEFWQFHALTVVAADANHINAIDAGGAWYRTGGFGVSLMAAARVTTSAAQTLVSGTPAAITFATSRFNSGEWSLSSNPSRITAVTDGIYVLSGSASFAANPNGYRKLSLRVNGSVEIASNQLNAVSSLNTTNLAVSSTYKLVTGDYVELVALQNCGGSLDVLKADQYSPELAATRLSSLTPLSPDTTTPPIVTTTPPSTTEQIFQATSAGWYRVWSGAYPASGSFNIKRVNNGDGQTSDTLVDFTIIAGSPEGIINVGRNAIPIIASPSIDAVRVLHDVSVSLAYVEVHLLRGGEWHLLRRTTDTNYLDAPFIVPDSVAYATASLTYGIKPNVTGGTGTIDVPQINSGGNKLLSPNAGVTWAAATGTPARTTYDTATATLTQVAQRLKAVIDDLITQGVFQVGIPSSMIYTDMLALAASLISENQVANITDIFRVSVAPDTTVQGIYTPIGTFGGHNFYKIQGYEYEIAGQNSPRQCYWSSAWTTWTISNAGGNLYHSGAAEANPWNVVQWKDQASANVAVTTIAPNIPLTYNALTDDHTAMIISGSSYGWNGLYLRGADLNGKRRYYQVGTGSNNTRIEWTNAAGGSWLIKDDTILHYSSAEGVSFPDQVVTWAADNSDVIGVTDVMAVDLMSGLTVGDTTSTYNGTYVPVQGVYNALAGRKLVYRRTDGAFYIQNNGSTWTGSATVGGTSLFQSTSDGNFPWNAAWTLGNITVQQSRIASPGWNNLAVQPNTNITNNIFGNWHL